MMRLAHLVAVVAAPFALSACADPAPLYVDQAWVQMNANPKAPASGYFVIHGGPEAVTLRAIQTEGALRIEMHDNVMKDGMMRMTPLDSVDVPALAKVAFAPGGKHLMIFGVNPAVVTAGKLTMTMFFSNGDRILVDAAIKLAGAADNPAPMNAVDHTH